MSTVIAIDPGTTQSGYVKWDTRAEEILEKGLIPNEQLLNSLRRHRIIPVSLRADAYVVEGIASYGMPVGATVFETCYMIGRILEITGADIVYRKDIKMYLCGTTKAKDANVRQALIDRYEPTLEPKKRPKGKLKGISKDIWSALAVAVFYSERVREE